MGFISKLLGSKKTATPKRKWTLWMEDFSYSKEMGVVSWNKRQFTSTEEETMISILEMEKTTNRLHSALSRYDFNLERTTKGLRVSFSIIPFCYEQGEYLEDCPISLVGLSDLKAISEKWLNEAKAEAKVLLKVNSLNHANSDNL